MMPANAMRKQDWRGRVENMRGEIETFETFADRNLKWWRDNHRGESVTRKAYYDRFLDAYNIRSLLDSTKVVGEVGPGPFGGMLQVCDLPARQKVFVDPLLDKLVGLHFVDWPVDSIFVASEAEEIPLPANSVDVLVSYNCLDHGWDIYQAISECIRISKKCFLAFDCRASDPYEMEKRRAIGDKDHYQSIRYHDIDKFLGEISANTSLTQLASAGKSWPVAVIEASK